MEFGYYDLCLMSGGATSDGETAEGLKKLTVDGLVVFDGLGEGHIDDLVIADADHHVALFFKKSVDSGCSHA